MLESKRNKLLSIKPEELNKLSKKELISLYKEIYEIEKVRTCLTKIQLIQDIRDYKSSMMRNDAIDRTKMVL